MKKKTAVICLFMGCLFVGIVVGVCGKAQYIVQYFI